MFTWGAARGLSERAAMRLNSATVWTDTSGLQLNHFVFVSLLTRYCVIRCLVLLLYHGCTMKSLLSHSGPWVLFYWCVYWCVWYVEKNEVNGNRAVDDLRKRGQRWWVTVLSQPRWIQHYTENLFSLGATLVGTRTYFNDQVSFKFKTLLGLSKNALLFFFAEWAYK